jgi:hypothetical protein
MDPIEEQAPSAKLTVAATKGRSERDNIGNVLFFRRHRLSLRFGRLG